MGPVHGLNVTRTRRKPGVWQPPGNKEPNLSLSARDLTRRIDLVRDRQSEDHQTLLEIRDGVKLILAALNYAAANGELPRANPEPATQGADVPRLQVLKSPARVR